MAINHRKTIGKCWFNGILCLSSSTSSSWHISWQAVLAAVCLLVSYSMFPGGNPDARGAGETKLVSAVSRPKSPVKKGGSYPGHHGSEHIIWNQNNLDTHIYIHIYIYTCLSWYNMIYIYIYTYVYSNMHRTAQHHSFLATSSGRAPACTCPVTPPSTWVWSYEMVFVWELSGLGSKTTRVAHYKHLQTGGQNWNILQYMFNILSKLVKLVQTQLTREEACWAPAVQDAGAQAGHVPGMAFLTPWNLWKPKIPRAAVANCSAKIGARIPDSADLNNSILSWNNLTKHVTMCHYVLTWKDI